MKKFRGQAWDLVTMACAIAVALWAKGPAWTAGSTVTAFIVLVAVYLAIKLTTLVIGTIWDTKKERPPRRRGERS